MMNALNYIVSTITLSVIEYDSFSGPSIGVGVLFSFNTPVIGVDGRFDITFS